VAAAVRLGTGAGVSPVIGPAGDIARQIAKGTRSAAAVLAQCKGLIEARDPALNCFTAKTFERAEREAAAIDALYTEGKALPPLAGVPYAVKNLFDVEGLVTLAGANIPANGNCSVTISVKSATAGNYSNDVAANALSTAPAGGNSASASASLTVTAPSGGGGGGLDWLDMMFVVGVLLAGRRHVGRGPPPRR